MSCLCGHFESCKHCSPYYQEMGDPVWLRGRLIEAVGFLREASEQMGFDDTDLGERVLAWLPEFKA
jgi:hypothetical protein